jgi:capsular polysaccharide biosynthesis protein
MHSPRRRPTGAGPCQVITLLRRAKHRLARLLQRLPVSSETIGPPKAVCPSVKAWLGAVRAASPGTPAGLTEIHPATKVVHSPPLTTDAPIHWKFRAAQTLVMPATFVARVPQGRVWGLQGAVITPDDRLLGETTREFGRTPEQNSIFQQLRLCPARRVRGRVAVLATAGSDVYFHWMFDLLPRWRLLQLAGETTKVDYWVINHRSLPFQLESLATLGIPPEKIIAPDSHWSFHVKADELVVPSLPAPLDTVNSWSCAFLRETFLPPGPVAAGRRLFVSRRQAVGRHLRNEAEVTAVLAGLGFEGCVLEGMSLTAQAALFASAECVVAPHGAGLTNLVFCRPGTTVVDLFSPNWVNPCYWTLCQAAGLNYHYLIGRGATPPEFNDPMMKGDDITVDLVKLQKILRSALGP